MRKLLMATAAILSGSVGMADLAYAQATPAPVPAPNPNLGTGAPFTAVPGQTPLANPGANTNWAPSPGGVQVRFNVRVNFYAQAGSDSGRNPGLITTATGATTAGNTVVGANTKIADYSFGEYTRFYPGFDGIAANGLKYGGFVEVRQDQAQPPGGGINGSISADTRNRDALYLRVASTYIGTDQLGFLRVGETYGPSTLFITGTFENFNDGAWNGDLPGFFTANTQIVWPFADVGNMYTTTKAVYLSPQFFGFDGSVSFEPNTGNGNNGGGNCPYANTAASSAGVTGPLGNGSPQGCDATTATSVNGEQGRRKNTVEAYLRYRGAFGPVGVALQGGAIESGKVAYDGTSLAALQYTGLNVYDVGGQVTFGGLAVGGHITGGRYNGQWSLDPKEGKDAFNYLVGASYAVGPVIIGGSYLSSMYAGLKTGQTPGPGGGATTNGTNPFVGNVNQWGVAAGATYSFAPGMNIFLSYLYDHRKELGVDLLTGVASTATARVTTHNNIQAQGISIGTQFRW